MQKNIKVIFTKEMLSFLRRQGYTHIYNKGVGEPRQDDEYVVVPLKSNDTLFQSSEKSILIEDINSSEIIEMSKGDPLIRFSVELPIFVYEKYLKN